ncbi:MAG TPA: RnfABCDGE type electron transport complex subunit G [Bacteroidales bacterium]|nr:RnfABCDGE type electron transport complex subunit G [Bacteroidales bacterium]
MESSFKNMVLTLLSVTLVSSFLLASVYNFTKEPISAAREAKRQQAISQVVPPFDRIETQIFPGYHEGDSLEFHFAYMGEELVGIAVATYTTSGFSGLITAMVGFYPDGRIVDVVHLQHRETPGLGDKIEKGKSDWSNQFRGIDPRTTDLRVTKDGGDIDGITAATITARAYSEAIQKAFDTLEKQVLQKEGGNH